MYITVKLLKGYSEPLTYKIPETWPTTHLIGSIVRVPLRNKLTAALVIDTFQAFATPPTYAIKYAESLETLPQDATYHAFIVQLSSYYQVDSLHFIKRLKQFLLQKEAKENLVQPSSEPTSPAEVILTPEQQAVVDFCTPHISTPAYTPTLIHGVTGSGKTEIYKKLITHAWVEQKTAILLLPEVTLAVNFYTILRQQLPNSIPIFSFHSATSVKEKKALWQALLANKPVLIIGVHLPILLPITNLGLIIIDEEHEVGFQEKKHPKINSKEAALLRAQYTGIPIILGSATPSLSSIYNARTKGWHFFQLKKRFAGAFPKIEIVSLADKKERRNFWISSRLEAAIKDRLAKKEQTIIFLNRRGYSFFVQCSACSFIFECPHCSVSLTLHEYNHLNCHYCDYHIQQPPKCPTCAAPESVFIKKGIGTQQVVSILQKLVPHARIGRADLDTTVNKKVWQQTMQDMHNGTLDILVGTQTITKGYHFPQVTLVGVLWADLNLHFPMFNAGETTLQQLIQVAGRAGRQHEDSLVIVQAMMNHPIFSYLNEVDYMRFYDTELEHRTTLSYPPTKRLVELELKHDNESQIDADAQRVVEQLLELATPDIIVLGPAKPPVHKIQNTHRRKIYLKSESMSNLIMLFQRIAKDDIESHIFFTPNPLSL